MKYNLSEMLSKYVPPKENWTPVDEALYKFKDISNVDPKIGDKLRFDAIKYAFTLHYNKNKNYFSYCKTMGVSPKDIQEEKDLFKIPLIADTSFKEYPSDMKLFPQWLKDNYTGILPDISPEKNFDLMIDKLDKLGINLVYSSSSSGRFSFAARDRLTTNRMAYANARLVLNALPFTDVETLTPFTPDTLKIVGFLPKPGGKHYIFFNTPRALFDIFPDVVYGINKEVSTSLMRINSGHPIGIKEKSMATMLKVFQKNLIWKISKKIKEAEQIDKTTIIFMPPAILILYMNIMEKKNITYDFSERLDGNIKGIILTGGGYKSAENIRINADELRERIEYNFNIPQSLTRDWYGMTETSITCFECSHHYKHIPFFAKIFSVDEDGNRLPYGERGRLCILDPLGNSYSSFIMTGDQGTVLEKCPGCGRGGNVLDNNISRIKGETAKGCSEALIRLAGARK
jgi:hypothetical protein